MTEVICPDCGKYIAPQGQIDPAIRCRCADAQAAPAAPVAGDAIEQIKRCYVCGADISHRKRLKDHLGRYWCGECARADHRARKRMKELQCPDCGRMFPPIRLMEYGDTKVCKTCYKKRLDHAQKKLVKLGHAAATKRRELKYIKWMLAVILTLVAIATYFQFFR